MQTVISKGSMRHSKEVLGAVPGITGGKSKCFLSGYLKDMSMLLSLNWELKVECSKMQSIIKKIVDATLQSRKAACKSALSKYSNEYSVNVRRVLIGIEG